MPLFSSLFSQKQNDNKEFALLGYTTEFHNHLLVGIDDGVQAYEEAIAVINSLSKLGIKRVITTPHIKTEVYNNTPEIIAAKLEKLQIEIAKNNIEISIEAAAEYYLDEVFLEKTKSSESLLSFGDRYILFETSHVDQSPLFIEAVFNLRLQGYKPIFAHPERYQYAFFDFSILERMYDSGVFFQMNINSLNGYYGKEAQKQAKLLVDKGMVDFFGTDAHGMRHIEQLQKSISLKEYQKVISSGKLLNNTI